MARLFADILNTNTPVTLSLEEVRQEIQSCDKALSKIHSIKANSYDVSSVYRDLTYVNGVIGKYGKNKVSISKEENVIDVNTKMEEAESSVQDIKSDLVKKEEELKKEEEVAQPQPVEPTPEPVKVEDTDIIKKYPVNEETLTKYALTSPNLLNASTVALKASDELGEAPTVVNLTKAVLSDASDNANMVKVVGEHYNKDISLLDNVHRFFNSREGREWLQSDKGRSWVEYSANKHKISLEDNIDINPDDIDVNEEMDVPAYEEEYGDVLIAMESSNAAISDYVVNGQTDDNNIDGDPDTILTENETLAKLSENSDRISRLENEIDLVSLGINNIDNIQASSSVSLESARTYNTILNSVAIRSSKVIGYKFKEDKYNLSTEDMKYDPVGSLVVARESLVEVFNGIYEAIKKLIDRIVKFLKKYFHHAVIRSKLVNGKAKAAYYAVKSMKGDIDKDKFETIRGDLTDKYRNILYLIAFDLKNAGDYIADLGSTKLRKIVTTPLKELYGILNQLNSGMSKEQAIGNDISKINKVLSKDNIFNRVLKDRNPNMSKLDDKTDLKDATENIRVLFAGTKYGHAVRVTEVDGPDGKTTKYELKQVTLDKLTGVLEKTPSKNHIMEIYKQLCNCSKTTDLIYKDSEDILAYADKFIDSFSKFNKDDNSDSDKSKEITKSVSSIVSYAKSIVIQYSGVELSNYINNCSAFLKIANECVLCMK